MFAVLLIAALLETGSPRDLYEKGVALFQASRFEESAKTLAAAAALDSANARVWKALGAAYVAQGLFELAEQPFASACRLEPKLRDACYYLGRNRYTTNRFEASLEALQTALKYDDRPARVHVTIAQDLDALGRPAEAEAHFETAIKLNGRAPAPNRMRPEEDPRLAYGTFLFRSGRTEDALRPFNSVIAEYPDCAAARLEYGRALYQLGRYTDAVANLERAVALDPDSSAAHMLLGKVLLRLDRGKEAEIHLERGRLLESRPQP